MTTSDCTKIKQLGAPAIGYFFFRGWMTKTQGVTEIALHAESQIDQPTGSTQEGALLRVELTCVDTE